MQNRIKNPEFPFNCKMMELFDFLLLEEKTDLENFRLEIILRLWSPEFQCALEAYFVRCYWIWYADILRLCNCRNSHLPKWTMLHCLLLLVYCSKKQTSWLYDKNLTIRPTMHGVLHWYHCSLGQDIGCAQDCLDRVAEHTRAPWFQLLRSPGGFGWKWNDIYGVVEVRNMRLLMKLYHVRSFRQLMLFILHPISKATWGMFEKTVMQRIVSSS